MDGWMMLMKKPLLLLTCLSRNLREQTSGRFSCSSFLPHKLVETNETMFQKERKIFITHLVFFRNKVDDDSVMTFSSFS